jgi:AmiR/NasT family two-component response regulator
MCVMQAKGILMERYNISADRAFAVLVRVSQHNNRKRDVAEELISSRRLRDLEPRPDAAAT